MSIAKKIFDSWIVLDWRNYDAGVLCAGSGSQYGADLAIRAFGFPSIVEGRRCCRTGLSNS
jgi:hypothetical protein